MAELSWIELARSYLSLRENTSKTEHNPAILDMLKQMGNFTGEAKAWWRDDETPWCGLFVGYCLGSSDRYVVKEWYRALAWQSKNMYRLDAPAYGCVVTFTRDGGGHVGFVVGVDKAGNLMVLGGNQGNAVTIAPFAVSRATGYYWPSKWDGSPVLSTPNLERYNLPLLKSDGRLSTNEA